MRDWKEEFGQPPRTCLPTLRDWAEWTPPSTCFEPTTALMAVSTAASIGGSIAGGIGQQQGYEATANEARYRAQVAENNRIIAEQNARYATQAGRANAQAQDYATAAGLGTAAAARGASGLDVATGSPVQVASSMGQLGRLKSLQDIQQADLEAYGYRQRAADYGAEAGLQQYKAGAAEAAKGPALAGTILGGAASLSDKWLRYKGGGLFGSSPSSGLYGTGGGPDY